MPEEVYEFDAENAATALRDRELLGSTGVGRGVAIPHARLADIEEVVGLFSRIQTPVEFDSMDDRPVDLVFTLFAPLNEGAEHLKALALVSRTLRNEDICRKLRANDTPSALYDILCEGSAIKAA